MEGGRGCAVHILEVNADSIEKLFLKFKLFHFVLCTLKITHTFSPPPPLLCGLSFWVMVEVFAFHDTPLQK